MICRVKQSKGVSVKCEECVNVNRFSSRFAFLPIVETSVSATSRQFKFSTVDWLINLCLFVNVMEANTYSLLKFSSVKASHCECVYLICGQFHVPRWAKQQPATSRAVSVTCWLCSSSRGQDKQQTIKRYLIKKIALNMFLPNFPRLCVPVCYMYVCLCVCEQRTSIHRPSIQASGICIQKQFSQRFLAPPSRPMSGKKV